MMHFSIPDSQEVKGKDSSSYLVYNIHINGAFHCALRYRQLLSLHEQLRRQFGKFPPFPPKRFLTLTTSQLEDRRLNLEKWLQTSSQNPEVASSELFNGFFLLAQHETDGQPIAKKPIDVFLQNGHCCNIDLWNNAPTSVLLKAVASELKIKDEYNDHFGLFIFRKEVEGVWTAVRKLGEYESPLISLSWLTNDHRIIFRRCSWDLSLDDLLVEDRAVLYILFSQTISDIENGWIPVPKEVARELNSLQSKGYRKEYMKLARRLKYYGFMKFPNCQTDHPHPSNNVTIYIGNKQLIYIPPSKEEIIFKVTRIKCWRITIHHENGGRRKTELSFEYLQSKETLEWISLSSEQAITMALCLQEMVNDMVSKQEPSSLSLIGVPSVKRIFYYIRRDAEQIPLNEDALLSNPLGNNTSYTSSSTTNGSSGAATPSSSASGHLISSGGSRNGSSGSTSPISNLSRHNSYEVPFSKRKSSHESFLGGSGGGGGIGGRQSSIASSNNEENLFLENSAFTGIGDDDL